jgi:hypothetical protein
MNFIILVPRLIYFNSFFDSVLAAGVALIFSVFRRPQAKKDRRPLNMPEERRTSSEAGESGMTALIWNWLWCALAETIWARPPK